MRHLTSFESFEAQFGRAASQLADREGDPRLKKIGVSKRTWERWCSGDVITMPRPDTCRVLEAMFGHTVGELLAPAALHSPLRPGTSRDDPPGDDIGRTIEMAARRARQFSASVPDATNVGRDALDQLRDEAVRIAEAYPREPLPALLPDLAQLQGDTLTLIEGRQPPALARDLYVVAALASGMMAKASHDMRDPHAAMTHARLAWQCASNADHNPLLAWIRGLESLVKYWAGQPREANEYATAGLGLPGVEGSVRVWLYSLRGRAVAALGDADGALRAIEQAQSTRDSMRPDDLDSIGGMCTFDPARQAYYAADACTIIPAGLSGSPLAARAQGYAGEAISAYASASAPSFGDQAGSHAALAIARARAGEIEGAAEAIEPVLALPPAMRINGVVACVTVVHRELSAVADRSAVAAQAQQAIEAFCHVSSALGR